MYDVLKGKVQYNVKHLSLFKALLCPNAIFETKEGVSVRKMNFILEAYFTPSITLITGCIRVEKVQVVKYAI